MGFYLPMADTERRLTGTVLREGTKQRIRMLADDTRFELKEPIGVLETDLLDAAAECLRKQDIAVFTMSEVISHALAYVMDAYSEGAAPM